MINTLSSARLGSQPFFRVFRVFRGFCLCVLLLSPVSAQRVTVPLDGTWQIEDSQAPTEFPKVWRHEVPVPGLANLASPPFPNVDLFDSRELIDNRIRAKALPESARIDAVGISRQQRNYFWYRRTFRVQERKQVAILKIGKAQFGTRVWLNGKNVGDHSGCFTAGYFDLTKAMKWESDNELIVRVGAHPAALPPFVPTGTDLEKLKWTPGIYDKISISLSDNPVIETVQVASKLEPPRIVVQTLVRNYGDASTTASIRHEVTEWRSGRPVATSEPRRFQMEAGEVKTITEEIPMPGARLWSPEEPFLYSLKTSSGGDSALTRFGIREFRFDTPTRRAYLNGKPYFLRGSNIALHRFFEDPKCGRLPWDESWVRKLLGEIPKRMHWNAFRFSIGPVPEAWFDIADEVGLLIQNEYFIWTGEPGEIRSERWKEWSTDQLLADFKEYMRDHWNHASQVIWDACNETDSRVLGDRIVPEVRKLDLSARPWDNGYNFPSEPDDPVEDHPYLFIRLYFGDDFDMTELENMTGGKSSYLPHPSAHPVLINEYGWLWLNRDGTPTEITRKIYEKYLGQKATPEQRFELGAYFLAGLTEYWRAHRNAAGVLYFVYLTGSYPGAYTSDNFHNVEKLELEPHFADFVGEAFKPLGLYINFWQNKIERGERRRYAVMMVNDYPHDVRGKLTLELVDQAGGQVSRAETDFALGALGAGTYSLGLDGPAREGYYLLRATASVHGTSIEPTVCRRKVRVE